MSGLIIKVTLEEVGQDTWRRIEIPGGISFGDLHRILQIAFAWNDTHMHEFSFPEDDTLIGPSDGGSIYLDEDTERVDDYLGRYPSISYIYDFGCEWIHRIELEDRDGNYQKRCPSLLSWAGGQMEEDRDRSENARRKINAREISASFGKMSLEALPDGDMDEGVLPFMEEDGEDPSTAANQAMDELLNKLLELMVYDPVVLKRLENEPYVREAVKRYKVTHDRKDLEPFIEYMRNSMKPDSLPAYGGNEEGWAGEYAYDDDEDEEIEYARGVEGAQLLRERVQAEDSVILKKVSSFNHLAEQVLQGEAPAIFAKGKGTKKVEDLLAEDPSMLTWFLSAGFQLECEAAVPVKCDHEAARMRGQRLSQYLQYQPEDLFYVFDVEGFRALTWLLTVPEGPFDLDLKKDQTGFAAAILLGLLDYSLEERDGRLTVTLTPAQNLADILGTVEKSYKRKIESRISQSLKVERAVSLYGFLLLEDCAMLLDRYFKQNLAPVTFRQVLFLGSALAGKVRLSAEAPGDDQKMFVYYAITDPRVDPEWIYEKAAWWMSIQDYKEPGKDQIRGELPLVGDPDDLGKVELFLTGALQSRAAYGPSVMNALMDEVYKGRGISALFEIWERCVGKSLMPDQGMRVWFNLMNMGLNLGLPVLKGFSRLEVQGSQPELGNVVSEFLDKAEQSAPGRKTPLSCFPKDLQIQIYRFMKSGRENWTAENYEKLERKVGTSNQELECARLHQLLALGKGEEAEAFVRAIGKAHPKEREENACLEKMVRDYPALSLKEQILRDGAQYDGSLSSLPHEARREIGRILNTFKGRQ